MELKLIALFVVIAGFIIGALVRNFIRSLNEVVEAGERLNQLEQLNHQLAPRLNRSRVSRN